jgi:hypothetical protein
MKQTVVGFLSGYRDDPMWADHAEVSKIVLDLTIKHIQVLSAELEAVKREAVEVLKPFSFAAPYWQGFHDFQQITHRDHSLEVGHLRAARAFVEKHGRDG